MFFSGIAIIGVAKICSLNTHICSFLYIHVYTVDLVPLLYLHPSFNDNSHLIREVASFERDNLI
jgi:hypothetical protein